MRAVILGQDPYYQPGLACGLAFSVSPDLPPAIKRPLALRRILDELQPERRGHQPAGSTLQPWAANGVLLLNTVLTVREREAGSHAGHGWEQITGAALEALAAQPGPIVFLLWGELAKRQGEKLHLDTSRHIVLKSAHPAARLGRAHLGSFIDRRPFTRANEELERRGAPIINWALDGCSASTIRDDTTTTSMGGDRHEHPRGPTRARHSGIGVSTERKVEDAKIQGQLKRRQGVGAPLVDKAPRRDIVDLHSMDDAQGDQLTAIPVTGSQWQGAGTGPASAPTAQGLLITDSPAAVASPGPFDDSHRFIDSHHEIGQDQGLGVDVAHVAE